MKALLLAPILAALASPSLAGQPDPTPVSEPETLGLLAIAGVALAVSYFRKRK
ncbi:MAG: PEP-CTERM sorting domain-containing protein [Rhodocyclaceae bacterium]|nr:PEP-CTERM sorting domain-containing protein [Rhodocyclaceae bacterium]